jgi:hypothetical protein
MPAKIWGGELGPLFGEEIENGQTVHKGLAKLIYRFGDTKGSNVVLQPPVGGATYLKALLTDVIAHNFSNIKVSQIKICNNKRSLKKCITKFCMITFFDIIIWNFFTSH